MIDQCRAAVDKDRATIGCVIIVEVAAFDRDSAAVHEYRAASVTRRAVYKVCVYRCAAAVSVIKNASHGWSAVSSMLVGKVALHGAGVRKDIQCATVIIDGTKELGAVDNNAYSFKVEGRTLVNPHVGRLPQRNADAARLTWLYGDGTVLDRAQRRARSIVRFPGNLPIVMVSLPSPAVQFDGKGCFFSSCATMAWRRLQVKAMGRSVGFVTVILAALATIGCVAPNASKKPSNEVKRERFKRDCPFLP